VANSAMGSTPLEAKSINNVSLYRRLVGS